MNTTTYDDLNSKLKVSTGSRLVVEGTRETLENKTESLKRRLNSLRNTIKNAPRSAKEKLKETKDKVVHGTIKSLVRLDQNIEQKGLSRRNTERIIKREKENIEESTKLYLKNIENNIKEIKQLMGNKTFTNSSGNLIGFNELSSENINEYLNEIRKEIGNMNLLPYEMKKLQDLLDSIENWTNNLYYNSKKFSRTLDSSNYLGDTLLSKMVGGRLYTEIKNAKELRPQVSPPVLDETQRMAPLNDPTPLQILPQDSIDLDETKPITPVNDFPFDESSPNSQATDEVKADEDAFKKLFENRDSVPNDFSFDESSSNSPITPEVRVDDQAFDELVSGNSSDERGPKIPTGTKEMSLEDLRAELTEPAEQVRSEVEVSGSSQERPESNKEDLFKGLETLRQKIISKLESGEEITDPDLRQLRENLVEIKELQEKLENPS